MTVADIPRPDQHYLVEALCAYCECFPCRCDFELRKEACACGGIIMAAAHDWHDILEEVRRHNDGELHQAWRKASIRPFHSDGAPIPMAS